MMMLGGYYDPHFAPTTTYVGVKAPKLFLILEPFISDTFRDILPRPLTYLGDLVCGQSRDLFVDITSYKYKDLSRGKDTV